MSESTINSVENEEKVDEKPNADDPYAYLDRGDFSSEAFKIEIKNLPKYYGINELKKFLNKKLSLATNKIKAPKANCRYVFVCFRNEEDRESAINIINGKKWKGSELKATTAKPSADPLVKKRKEDSEIEECNKKPKVEDTRTQEERLKECTIPLWNVEYKDQLIQKQKDITGLLKKLGNVLTGLHNSTNIHVLLKERKEKYDGLPCELLDIRYSDIIEGYRNKCSFTVGIDDETNLPTVGFRTGSYVKGAVSVAPIDSLVHIPETMKIVVKIFQDFVRNSNLKVFDRELQEGHFKQLLVRTAPNQLMIVVGIDPQKLTNEELDAFKKSLINYFSVGDGKIANVTSLYYEKMVKKNSNDDFTAAEHLWGETHIYETVNNLKFRISPEAFFQINVPAAEILYNTAIELVEPTENSVILDVCCGTGTIGLCFSKKCKNVLGIESVPQAIVDAQENAKLNNIQNCQFFVGKAEDTLGSICYKTESNEVVAILDPPRAGLHKKAILQLRKIAKIKKVLYISCNPDLAIRNFIDLGRPESKQYQGEPFLPVRAVAVDMFPFTSHCELVIVFERYCPPENT